LWFVVPLAGSLLLARFLFALPLEPGNGALMVLLYAAVTHTAALLLTPLDSTFSPQALRSLANRCAIAAIIFLGATLIDPQTRLLFTQLLLAAVTLFLVLLATLSLVLARVKHRPAARQIVLSVTIALMLAPLWLGPLAEISGNSPLLSNTIVSVSPLSVIATSLDFDYLRTRWFYRYSVLGSLRYEYFPWPGYALILITVVAGCSFSAANVKFTRIAHSFRKRVTAS